MLAAAPRLWASPNVPTGMGFAGAPRRPRNAMPGLPVEFLISTFVTLFVVVDPVGLVPTFLAVTHGLPRSARRQIAVRASLIATAILVGAAAIGDWLPTRLGISFPAFRI